MDDNHIPTLRESEHEWAHRLMRVILPHINDGIYAMFKEAQDICKKSEEPEKYLITFSMVIGAISFIKNKFYKYLNFYLKVDLLFKSSYEIF